MLPEMVLPTKFKSLMLVSPPQMCMLPSSFTYPATVICTATGKGIATAITKWDKTGWSNLWFINWFHKAHTGVTPSLKVYVNFLLFEEMYQTY
jgi:hypothetical protein